MADNETNGLLGAIRELINELKMLTFGIKQDLAYKRHSRFTALEFKKITLTTAATPFFIDFSEPVNQLTIAVSDLGTANVVYCTIEGTAGTDSIELNANLRVLSFGDIPIKRISFYADVGTTTDVQCFGLRSG